MSCSATCRRTRSRASPSRRSSRSTRRSSTAWSCDRDETPRKGPQIPRRRAGGSGANGGAHRPEVGDRRSASRSERPAQIEGRRERLASREGTTRKEGGGPRGEGGRAEEEGRRGGVPPGGAGPPDEGTRGTRRGPLDRPRQARRGDTPRPRDNQGGGTDPREVARARSRGGRSPQDLAGSVGSSRGGTRTGTRRREKGPLPITP